MRLILPKTKAELVEVPEGGAALAAVRALDTNTRQKLLNAWFRKATGAANFTTYRGPQSGAAICRLALRCRRAERADA